MLRGLIDTGLLFLLPFAAYALFLALSRRFPSLAQAWAEGPVGQLIVAGLILAIGFLVLSGLFAPRHRGAYVPAHLENGTLVPGRIE